MKLYSKKNSKPLEEYLLSEGIVKRGSRIALAVSGGADSVAMLLFFLSVKDELDLRISVYHMEHGIRGEESVRDAKFVQGLCDKHRVEFYIKSADVPGYAKECGLSLEEAARKLRYEFLADAKEEFVAVAHNFEDNAETVLFNLIRGSGIDGLCGMEECRPFFDKTLIRPFLTISREDILKYLKDNNQDFCTDSTNSDSNYSRNSIRNNVFSELSKINSGFITHINNAAKALSDIRDYNNELVNAAVNDVFTQGMISNEIPSEPLLKLNPLIRRGVIRVWIGDRIGKKDITRDHYEAVDALLEKQVEKRVDLPGAVIIRKYNSLVIEKTEDAQSSENTETFDAVSININDITGNLAISEGGFSFELSTFLYKKDSPVPTDLYTKWFDCDKIGDKFSLRTCEEGDYFSINQNLNKKPFNRFCIDKKIPLADRRRIPLFVRDNHIIWAVGHRISEAFKIDDTTKRVLQIKATENSKGD